MEDMLYCSGCKTSKDVERFAKNRATKTGRANWCKDCLKGLWQTPENRRRRMERRNANWPHSLAVECRSRARKRGLPFDITAADLVVPEFCPVLGLRLAQVVGGVGPETPTVDRMDPAKGYVRGNVAVISWQANRLKSDCSDPAVFEAIAAYMRRGMDAGKAGEDQPGLQAPATPSTTAPIPKAVECARRPPPVRQNSFLYS